jgi:IPT/TIG domain
MRTLSIRSKCNGNRKRSKSCRPLVECMEPRTLLSAVAWTGAAGDNNWDTPANWSTHSIPGSNDDVTIDIAANVVHANDVIDSINSLISTEPLTISGGTLSIAATSTIASTLSITGGTLTGSGDLSVSGLVTLTSGTLSGESALNANGGMLINPADGVAAGNAFFLDARTINNAVGQTAKWSGGQLTLMASNGSVFNNMGTFLAVGYGYYSDSGNGAASSFVNSGNLTLTTLLGSIEFGVAFNVPGGSVDIPSESYLYLDGGGSATDAAFTIGSAGQLGFNNIYSLDTATTISGDGELSKGGPGTLVLSHFYGYTGPTYAGSGTLQIDGILESSSVTASHGTVSGTGTVGPLSTVGGELSPGDGATPGILNVQGDADIRGEEGEGTRSATFTVKLSGSTAGAGYSQLNVAGSVTLDDCDLDASLGFAPSNGEAFTIIKSTQPITGTFNDLPEGASLTIGNTPFTITYAGGDGNDVVLTQAIAVAPRPTITSISPSSGPASGGTLVTITGVGFTSVIGVDFGTSAARSFNVVNDTTITSESPEGTGTVDVTVDFTEYKTPPSNTDLFTYTVRVTPKVTGISPSSGLSAGGTLVTITGTGFTGATKVDFGKTPASGLVVQNDTTIIVHSPAGTGVTHVSVITPDGTSATSTADLFTYTAAVTVIAAPRVISLARFGFHMQPTTVVLTFSSALDAARAADVNNYQILTMGGIARNAALAGHITRVKAAVYNPATLTVTLHTAQRLDIHKRYRLTVRGAIPNGLKGATGIPLVGRGNGPAATNYVAVLTGKLLAGPAPATIASARKQ